ncbi:DUF5783 family protein [Halorarius halobius]|uniref:DUF5783 family protein n=1 Tax=Halorarius halobius TaxID=2962671 RepID=UPI0020CC80EC|nr:DUF5783 family protein [Halorarius halobius]
MSLDPETFEEQKYVDYFPKLQQAYKSAFNRMNERYDSTLVHGIDQSILNESEPHYEGDGEFTVELPDDPHDRIDGVVVVSDEKLDELLDVYVEELKTELRRVFDVPE